jgi:hypothetical protein
MMALWDIESPKATDHGFEVVKPVEVLDAFDGPLTFTFRNQNGVLLIANLCAVGVDASRYLVSETSDVAVSDLKNGLMPLRSALIRSPLWLIDVQPDGRVSGVWNTSLDTLPPEVIPETDALLTAELEAEQLADEKLAKFAKSDSDAIVAFGGGPVEKHEIEAGFFGKFFQGASELLVEICTLSNAPRPILRLGMTSESSYAVDLKVAKRSPEEENSDMFVAEKQSKIAGETRLRHAFEMFMSLIVDPRPHDDALTLVKSQYRLRQQYGGVLELISKNSATVAVRTRANPRPRSVSGMQASERLHVVRELGFPYMFLELRGMLIGGLTHRSGRLSPSFTIRVEIAEKPQDYTGTVPDSAVEQMKQVALDSQVWAKIQIHDDGKQSQIYTLSDIRIVDDGSPHYIK